MNKRVILPVLIASLLSAACKKNEVTSPPVSNDLNFSAEALAYVQLPLNRYFIYKDSATGILDSVVVTLSKIETIHVTLISSGNYQTFSLALTKYGGASPKEWFYGFADAGNKLMLKEKDRMNSTERNYVFRYPIEDLAAYYGVASTLSTITIEGKIYTNAQVYIADNGLAPAHTNYLKSTYYWVKGVGIIKREIQTSSSIKTDLLVRNN